MDAMSYIAMIIFLLEIIKPGIGEYLCPGCYSYGPTIGEDVATIHGHSLSGQKDPNIMQQSFVVKKSDGTTDVTYSLQQVNGREAVYIDTTSSLAAPRIIKVSHALKPTGQKGSDRHTVLAQAVLMDANNVPYTISASATWTIPRADVATDTLSKDVLAAMVNFLALSGARDALIDGIIP